MTNYRQGKIYRIVCNITGLTYYGSTCEPTLARRLALHVKNFKRFKEGKKQSYVTSYKVLEGGSYAIILVEFFPCDSKMGLHRRERFYIEGNDCVNQVIPTRTQAEYRVDNRIQISEYDANYYKENAEKKKIKRGENADKIKIRSAEWRLNNREKIKAYNLENKEKLKIEKRKYQLENKEKLKAYSADYYLKSKEARLANLNIPI
jgi:hypothetical protein